MTIAQYRQGQLEDGSKSEGTGLICVEEFKQAHNNSLNATFCDVEDDIPHLFTVTSFHSWRHQPLQHEHMTDDSS